MNLFTIDQTSKLIFVSLRFTLKVKSRLSHLRPITQALITRKIFNMSRNNYHHMVINHLKHT